MELGKEYEFWHIIKQKWYVDSIETEEEFELFKKLNCKYREITKENNGQLRNFWTKKYD